MSATSTSRPASANTRPATADQAIRDAEPLIRALQAQWFVMGGDRDDVAQAARIGVFKAWRDFNGTGHWPAFRKMCAVREVITAVKAATRVKHASLNEAVALDAPTGDHEDDRTLADEIADPGDSFHRAARLHDAVAVLRVIAHQSSAIELEVARLMLAGASYPEAAAALDVGVKTIDNAIQRVRRKLQAAGVVQSARTRSVERVSVSRDLRPASIRREGWREPRPRSTDRTATESPVMTRIATAADLDRLTRTPVYDPRRDKTCALCDHAFTVGEQPRYDHDLEGFTHADAAGCNAARARAAEKTLASRENGDSGSETRPSMPDPAEINSVGASRQDSGGGEVSPRLQREPIARLDQFRREWSRMGDESDVKMGRRREAIVEQIFRDGGPRSAMSIEHALELADQGVIASYCRKLAGKGALRRTGRSVRDWPAADRKPSPEYEWVPPAQREMGVTGAARVASTLTEAHARQPSGPPEVRTSGSPDVRDATRAEADDALRDRYLELLFEHVRVHPQHDHVFDRLERLLGLDKEAA